MQSDRSTYWFGGLSTILIILMGTGLYLSNGMPNRFDDKLQTLGADIDWTGEEYVDVKNGVKLGTKKSGQLDVIVWGDSHGRSSAEMIDNQLAKHHLNGIAYFTAGSPPFRDCGNPSKANGNKKSTWMLLNISCRGSRNRKQSI